MRIGSILKNGAVRGREYSIFHTRFFPLVRLACVNTWRDTMRQVVYRVMFNDLSCCLYTTARWLKWTFTETEFLGVVILEYSITSFTTHFTSSLSSHLAQSLAFGSLLYLIEFKETYFSWPDSLWTLSTQNFSNSSFFIESKIVCLSWNIKFFWGLSDNFCPMKSKSTTFCLITAT